MWSNEVISEVLTKCGFRDEMRSFLTYEEKITDCELVDVVCLAPIPLESKKDLLDKLIINTETENKIEEVWQKARTAREELEQALAEIYELMRKNPETVYQCTYIVDCWYDTDVFLEKEYPIGAFPTIYHAIEHIKNECLDEDVREAGDLRRLEVWDMDDRDRILPRRDYYTYNGEICWFERLYPYLDNETHNKEYSSYLPDKLKRVKRKYEGSFFRSDLDLNLQTPFKTGDIVNIDCRPFGPAFAALILEDSRQFDCCFPTILFRIPYTEEWRITPLKHGNFYKSVDGMFTPPLSALFRICTLSHTDNGVNKELIEMSRVLMADPDLGSRVWNRHYELGFGDMTMEQVNALLLE